MKKVYNHYRYYNNLASDLSYDACSMRTWFSQTFSAAKTIAELIPNDCKELREGRQRNPVNWTFDNLTSITITDRGFTGHEHMPSFGLINMNGRVYDPSIGQFLSADPFVNSPENSQSYNRFAYCLNNPLKFTDPSGYWPVGSVLWSLSPEGQYFWSFSATFEPYYDKWEKNNSSNNFVSTDGIILNNSNNNKPSIDVLGLWNSWNLLNNTHSIPTKSFGGFELDQSTSLSSGIRDERDAFFGAASYEDYLRNNYIKTERGMNKETDAFVSSLMHTFNTVIGLTGITVDAAKQFLSQTKKGSDIAYKFA